MNSRILPNVFGHQRSSSSGAVTTTSMTRANWLLALAMLIASSFYQLGIVPSYGLNSDFYLANTAVYFASLMFFLLGPRWPVSLHQILYLFYFIFFGLVPPLELNLGRSYWSGSDSVLGAYTDTMVLSLAGLLAFHAAYALSARHLGSAGKARPTDNPRLHPSALILISAVAAVTIYAMNSFSIESVFTRGGTPEDKVSLGQLGNLVFQFFIYPIPCVCLLLYAWSRDRPQLLTALALGALFVLANPITGMSRAQGASIYLAVASSFFFVLLQQRYLFSGLIFCGLFLAFPLLHMLRYAGYDIASYRPSLDFLTAGHFDSFQMFAHVVRLEWISGGYQLLGAILFFVPRSLWPDKPIGTGATIGEAEGFTLTNVSMNFMGEGYANFGMLGTLLFMAFLGWIFARLDRKFWTSGATASFRSRYLLLLGLSFFILRGDLMSSLAFTVGMMLTVVWVSTVVRIINP